jgi:hypothetical protein
MGQVELYILAIHGSYFHLFLILPFARARPFLSLVPATLQVQARNFHPPARGPLFGAARRKEPISGRKGSCRVITADVMMNQLCTVPILLFSPSPL